MAKKRDVIPPCVRELIRMVGPYIPVTEMEIVKPWPIGGFLLADHWNNQGAGRWAKAGSEDPWASSEACGGPKESQELEEDDDSIVEIPQEPKEPDVIIIDEEEEAPAALVEPHGAPVDGGGDHNYLHPFAAWSKPKD